MKRRPQKQIVLLNGNPNFDSSGFNKCFWSLIQNSRRDFNKSGFSSRKVSLVGKRQSRSFCMRLACQRVAGPAPPSLPAWRPARMQAERCRTPLEGFSLAMHAGTANKKKSPNPFHVSGRASLTCIQQNLSWEVLLTAGRHTKSFIFILSVPSFSGLLLPLPGSCVSASRLLLLLSGPAYHTGSFTPRGTVPFVMAATCRGLCPLPFG